MIDKGACDKRFILNPSNCECECDKSCNIGEYLDYEIKCRKKLVNKLVQECTEIDEEGKLAKKKKKKKIAEDENKHKNKCSSCTLYIVLFSIFFAIKVGIGTYFFYFYWYFKKILLALSLVSILKQQFYELINGKYEGNKYEKSKI